MPAATSTQRSPVVSSASWGSGPAITRNSASEATITTVLPIGAAAVARNRRLA